jgi:uncharacterized protein YegL
MTTPASDLADRPFAALLPVYLVIDESGSMAEAIPSLNHELSALLDSLVSNPLATAGIRLSIIGFSTDARCYLPLTDVSDLPSIPALHTSGSTSFAAVIELLSERLSSDIPNLRSGGYKVRRPVVFFLTDGVPDAGDTWQDALLKLRSEPHCPTIFAYGVGDSDANILQELAAGGGRAFQSQQDLSISLLVAQFVESLFTSIVMSSFTVNRSDRELIISDPDTFHPLDQYGPEAE